MIKFNLSKFGQRERILAVVVFIALEVAAFYHFLLKPKLNDIRTQQPKLAGREELLDAKKSKLRLLNQLEEQRWALKVQFDEFHEQFFSISDIQDFMKRLIQYADENDSELVLLDYQQTKEKERKSSLDRKRKGKSNIEKSDIENDNISDQSMEIVIRGYYTNLINILSRLETYEKLTNIKDLKVAYPKYNTDKLEAKITLDLHLDDGIEKNRLEEVLSASASLLPGEKKRSAKNFAVEATSTNRREDGK